MTARTVSGDGAFLEALRKRLDELEASALDAMVRGLNPDAYHRTCGRIEMIRGLRDTDIPEIIRDLQKD